MACRSVQRQQMAWIPLRGDRLIHNVSKDDKSQPMKGDQQHRSFDSVKIKYLNYDNIKYVILTKLESCTSQRKVHITCKVDSGDDGNLMPLKSFKILLPKSTIQALHAIKKTSIMFKTYDQSNIDQLGVCIVQLRHKDKIARSRLFVVPRDCLVLLGMPGIELIGILMIMCGMIKGQQANRKFNSQTME